MIDALIATARTADRVADAFVPAYRAALRALVPDVPAAALCVTEAKGNHPRALRTTLRAGRVTGHKVWSTAADAGEALLVCAVDGDAAPGDRPRLVLLVVRPDAPGLTLTRQPPAPFVPEVPHFEVRLEGVVPERVLPGDGWADYAKPFRTVEDIHVSAALHAMWLGLGERNGWPGPLLAKLHAQLAALRAIVHEDPSDPHTHLALAGVWFQGEALLEEMAPLWEHVDVEVARRWKRDKALMKVASTPRRLRFERALAALGR